MTKVASELRLVCLFIGCLFTTALAAEEKLTNDSVIEMHKLGLGDSVIVEKIEVSSCNFDVSLTALKQLKEAGISDAVIAAMISAGASKPTAVPAGDPNDPSASHEPGIWLYQEEGGQKKMTKIEPTVFAQIKAGPAAFAVYGQESKARAVMSGAHAKLKLNIRRPVFYLYFEKTQSGLSDTTGSATSPEDFTLMKMEVREKHNERRVVIGKAGLYSGAKSGYDAKSVHEIDYEKASTGVYRVTPKEDLTDGEYCILYTGTSTFVGFGFAAGGLRKGFCFGVQTEYPAK
jgi:hypothetical protein